MRVEELAKTLVDVLLLDWPSPRAMTDLVLSSSLSNLNSSGQVCANIPCNIAKDANILKSFIVLIVMK